MRRLLMALAVVALASLLAACGGGHESGVFAVKKGMTEQQVRKLAGSTYVGSGANCRLYRATSKDSALDGMRLCFTNGHVSRIQTAVHG